MLETLHSPRFQDAAPAAVYAPLLDEGTYLASERTMYRLLAAEGETFVNRIYHLDRGFERLEEKLGACGAQVRRLKGDGEEEVE